MSLKLYRPGDDGLQPDPEERPADWRVGLRSRRWRPAPLENPEVDETHPAVALLFFLLMGAITFGLLVLGYASGFWGSIRPVPSTLAACRSAR